MASKPRYRLVNPGLLHSLMERTGTGAPVSRRRLATAVGVPHGTIDALLTGQTKTQPASVAHGICEVIGVDLLILWAPTGRSVPASDPAARVAVNA